MFIAKVVKPGFQFTEITLPVMGISCVPSAQGKFALPNMHLGRYNIKISVI
jgi:hypothetical protein